MNNEYRLKTTSLQDFFLDMKEVLFAANWDVPINFDMVTAEVFEKGFLQTPVLLIQTGKVVEPYEVDEHGNPTTPIVEKPEIYVHIRSRLPFSANYLELMQNTTEDENNEFKHEFS